MTDLSDFKRLVYEPEVQALRERIAEIERDEAIERSREAHQDHVDMEELFLPLEERAEAAEQERDEARKDWDKLSRKYDELHERAEAAEAELEAAREAFGTILDLLTGWTRPMADDDRAALIGHIARAFLARQEPYADIPGAGQRGCG